MNYRTGFKHLISFVVSLIFLTSSASAQWKGSYGNEWMNPSQPYLKVLVEKQGLHRISLSSLPSDFPLNDLAKIQLWHRGVQVAISITSTEIQFFGETNDGASDSLVYRPETARMNPYSSLYSDKGAYFLTSSTSRSERITAKNYSDLTRQPAGYHLQEDVTTFKNQFAFTTFDIKAALNKSYYEAVNTWTGPSLAGVKTSVGSVKDTVLVKPFLLKNFKADAGVVPTLEMLFAGINVGAHNIEVYVGKSDLSSDMRKVGTVNFTGFDAKKGVFALKPEDVKADGSGFVKIRSATDITSGDWYTLAYYKITYPQGFDMTGSKSSTFTLPGQDESQSVVKIGNSAGDLIAYDVTDKNRLVKLGTSNSNGNTLLLIDRVKSKKSILFATYASEIVDVLPANISKVNFKPVFPTTAQAALGFANPSDYDYLIVTNTQLSAAATRYAEYRNSTVGGSYRVLVMNINDIYNQFNYGEPSPIGLRRFVNYMLKSGVRDAHNLLLIGHSVSYPTTLIKEMPDEVPTFGDPGADILLVAGLAGYDKDVPAIPVGRISVFKEEEALSYLDKVKVYESETDNSWRKRILHLNGGHSVSEVNQLKSVLEALVPIVETGEVGGMVKAYVKNNSNPSQPQKISINGDVNEGVGMITFFGHGSQTITDLDFGYVTDVSRGYENANKYPAMFFNGCGVGNLFTNHTKFTLSGDWIAASNKGAVAIIANSYDSYVSSSSSYLKHLYTKLFGEKKIYPIGEAIKQVTLEIIKEGATDYEIANFQQSNLQGDPVIRLIRVSKSDFAVSDHSVLLYSDDKSVTLENSKNPKIAIVLSNYGKFDIAEKPSVRIRLNHNTGSPQTINLTGMPVAYSDTLWVPVTNLATISSISVKVDPENLISELSEANNDAHLDVDWEVAKSKNIYSNELVTDVIAPQLLVTIDKRRIMDGEIVAPSPEIEIQLLDDRTIDPNPELIEVYIKPCYGDVCEFERVPSGLLDIKQSGTDGKTLVVNYKGLTLLEGKYELLVTGKDEKGNLAASSYQIRFEIKPPSEGLTFICYPNPASEYVKFQIKAGKSEPVKQVKWEIYNSSGRQIDKGEQMNESSEVVSWYWTPNAPNGVYIYKAVIVTNTGESEMSGKISLIR